MAGVIPTSYGSYTYLTGTIEEVAGALVAMTVSASRVIWWTDDGSDARCLYYGSYQAQA